MNKQNDPVDSALNVLRSEHWAAGQTFDPDLENRLMQNFNERQNTRRFAHPRAMLLALAVLAVGGVTLAATDGVAKFRQWLVTLEINGQTLEVTLDDNGESTFDYPMANGATATVNIQKSNTPENGDMTQIQVTTGDDQTEDVEVAKVVRKCSPADAIQQYTLDDLGDAQPVKSWFDADGTAYDLYTIVQKDGDWQFYVASQSVKGEEPVVRQVGRVPTTVLPADSEPTIDVGDDGTLTITLKTDDGQERVLKLLMRQGDADSPTEDGRQIRLRTHAGDEIKVDIDQIGEDEPEK